MDSQILKPEITNISKEVWDTLKVRWQFWTVLAVAIILSVILVILVMKDYNEYVRLLFIPFAIIFVYIYSVQEKIRTSFWRQLAKINGWHYKDYGDPEQESGVMFGQGRKRRISHIIKGGIDNRQFRIFNYEFDTGPVKNGKTHFYTIFAFKFNGSFPHIYLNNRHNFYGVGNIGEAIPLSGEFEKEFFLSAPKEYEIEALEIFTPDLLADLLDKDFAHDVEFVNQEVLIFTEGHINDFEELDGKFNQVLELEDLLDEKLDKFKFHPIGDMPYSL